MQKSPVPTTPNLERKNELKALMGSSRSDLVQFVGPQNSRILFSFLLSLKSPNTRRAYFFDLIHFFKFLKVHKSSRDFRIVAREDIDHFKERMLRYGPSGSRGLSQSSVKRKVTAISKFYTFLIREKVIKANPCLHVERPSVPLEVKSEALTQKEFLKILSVIDENTPSGALHRAILLLLGSTGMRVGELINIKVSDYIKEDGGAIIYIKANKSSLSLKKELSEKVTNAINHYLIIAREKIELEDYLFMGNRGAINSKLSHQAIYKMIVKYAHKAGIKRKITPHSARVFFITQGLEHVSIEEMQAEVGHKSIVMTNEYDKRRKNNSKKLAEAVL